MSAGGVRAAADIAGELRAAIGRPVMQFQRHLSENLHFLAYDPDLGPVFVKVYSRQDRFTNEGRALAMLQCRSGWTISVVADGYLPRANLWWRSFPYLRLHSFSTNRCTAPQAARLLADVHTTPLQDLSLPVRKSAVQRLPELVEDVSRFSQVGSLASEIWSSSGHILSKAANAISSTCFLNNDFGDRNILYFADTGGVTLIDFEHATLGDPHWDFAKAWDRELSDRQVRNRFLSAYLAATQTGSFPNPAVMWCTRFAVALEIFPYAVRVKDNDYLRHGTRKLQVLAEEARTFT